MAGTYRFTQRDNTQHGSRRLLAVAAQQPNPGVVQSGTTYGTNAAVGTYSISVGTYTDPGEANVLSPTTYIYNSQNKTGSATLPAAQNVATGSGTYGKVGSLQTPSYPTTATTQSADALAITLTTLDTAGGDTTVHLPNSVTATIATSTVYDNAVVVTTAADVAVVNAAKGNIVTGTTILGAAGTYTPVVPNDARKKSTPYFGVPGSLQDGNIVIPTVDNVVYGVPFDINSEGTAVLTLSSLTIDDIIAALRAAALPINIISPVSADTRPTLTIIRGDAYNPTTAQRIIFTANGIPSLTTAEVMLRIYATNGLKLVLADVATIVSGTTLQTITFDLAGHQTYKLTPDSSGKLQSYEVVAKYLDGSARTIVLGPCVVINAPNREVT